MKVGNLFHNPNRHCLTFSIFASGINVVDKTNYLAHPDAIVLSTVDFSSGSISLCVQTLKPHPLKSRRKHLTIVLFVGCAFKLCTVVMQCMF